MLVTRQLFPRLLGEGEGSIGVAEGRGAKNLDRAKGQVYHPPKCGSERGTAWRKRNGGRRLSHRMGYPASAWLAAGMLAAGVFTSGCAPAHAVLWADTALPDGRFSAARHQWAYDGEPVQFELQVTPGGANYIVFGKGDEASVVDMEEGRGQFLWTLVFQAGHEPQDYEIYAVPFLIRDARDWIYDKNEKKWYFYPPRNDESDVQTAPEQVMRITCYRREISMTFKARGGRPRRVTMTLVKGVGDRVAIAEQRPGASPEGPSASPAVEAGRGFLLLGPNEKGGCGVSYLPLYNEVNRAGTTQVEVVVEHGDGSLERMVEKIDTP